MIEKGKTRPLSQKGSKEDTRVVSPTSCITHLLFFLIRNRYRHREKYKGGKDKYEERKIEIGRVRKEESMRRVSADSTRPVVPASRVGPRRLRTRPAGRGRRSEWRDAKRVHLFRPLKKANTVEKIQTT